jgi:hypothetical protein
VERAVHAGRHTVSADHVTIELIADHEHLAGPLPNGAGVFPDRHHS